MALIGLAFLLFLAGLEIEFDKLRGQVLRLASLGFALSFAIAVAASFVLKAAGLVDTPLLVAIILSATSLGVIIPVLKDAGEISSTFGQLVVAAGTIADFGAIILLSLFFSGEGGVGSTLVLLGALVGLAVAVFLVVSGAEHSMRIRADLLRLQDTTAQISVRGAVVLFMGFAALAENFGLEVILGAFTAGAVLTLVDRDQAMTHPDFRRKLEAMGFGFFIPVFFVRAACASTSTRSRQPFEPGDGADLPGRARWPRAASPRCSIGGYSTGAARWSPGCSSPPPCRSSSPPPPSGASSISSTRPAAQR